MSGLRKSLGQRIKAARRAAGYKSARAFADAIGVSESSVANAEIGSSRVGEGVYMDIESGLGWPHNSISQALNTGDFDGLQPSQPAPRADIYRRVLNRNDDWELRTMALDTIDLEQRWQAIFAHREQLAEDQQPDVRPGSSMRRSG